VEYAATGVIQGTTVIEVILYLAWAALIAINLPFALGGSWINIGAIGFVLGVMACHIIDQVF
jgi:hypothetical protein